ncbi:MAG: hypothetical protein ORN53_05235 [Crocinitomicaceae bacterium]|nr:hypothetical protein [Crocinitomicaceae bacterium]
MEILEKIVRDKLNRKLFISEFQESIWNAENANEILTELVYQLDFYEPDETKRREDPSYFGDDKLAAEVALAIQQLKEQNEDGE